MEDTNARKPDNKNYFYEILDINQLWNCKVKIEHGNCIAKVKSKPIFSLTIGGMTKGNQVIT